MRNELQIEELKIKSIQDDLFEALCLIKKVRNIALEIKGDAELDGTDYYADLDKIQNSMNRNAGIVSEIINYVMYTRLDDLVKKN